jgi:hypothetical protein
LSRPVAADALMARLVAHAASTTDEDDDNPCECSQEFSSSYQPRRQGMCCPPFYEICIHQGWVTAMVLFFFGLDSIVGEPSHQHM